MLFETALLAEEWEQGPKRWRNYKGEPKEYPSETYRLFSLLQTIMIAADLLAWHASLKLSTVDARKMRNLNVTSLWRPVRAGESGIHHEWRAGDVATLGVWDHPFYRAIANEINRRYVYNPGSRLLVALYAPHASARGAHIHFQVHPNTKERDNVRNLVNHLASFALKKV